MTDVVALSDGEGAFASLREVFGVNDDTPWQVSFYAFLAHVRGATVLVDTGLGPFGLDPFLPAWQGRLPQALAAAGVAPEQVDLVVLTHLHVDHVGWNMRDGVPFFPNARYVAHRDDYEWITAVDGDEASRRRTPLPSRTGGSGSSRPSRPPAASSASGISGSGGSCGSAKGSPGARRSRRRYGDFGSAY
jgi:glyoxylase-like metal-dependent hydrolase (beta-lactamase superfamily II)